MNNIVKEYYQNLSDLDLVLTIKEIKTLEPLGLIGDKVRKIAKEVRDIIGGESASLDLFGATVSVFREAALRYEKQSGFLTDDEFIEQYKPIMSDDGSNTLKEFEAIELYGLDKNYTWSWIEDGYKTYIVPGFRRINCIACYRTEVPHDNKDIVVLWTDDVEIDN